MRARVYQFFIGKDPGSQETASLFCGVSDVKTTVVNIRTHKAVRHNQNSQKKAGPFCDRSCGASWGREKQLDRL